MSEDFGLRGALGEDAYVELARRELETALRYGEKEAAERLRGWRPMSAHDELREVEGKVRDFLAQHGDENVERVMAEYDERGRELERLREAQSDDRTTIEIQERQLDRLRVIEQRARDLLTNPDEDETWKHAARYILGEAL